MRYSLVGILIVVALLAVVCAGMTYRTVSWTSAVVSISIALFAFMAIRAIALRGQSRAFAMAFLFVGGGYLLLAITTLLGVQNLLVTNYPLALAARVFRVDREIMGGNNQGQGGGGFFSIPSELGSSMLNLQQFGGGKVGTGQRQEMSVDEIIAAANSGAAYADKLQKFFLIGHCVWSWFFGLLAGWISTWLFRQATRGELVSS